MPSNPIENLQQQRPDLFQSPPFWSTCLEDISETAAKVRMMKANIIGKSAGGKDLIAFTSGELEEQHPTATISSAMASDRPESFYDPKLRTHPSLVLIGSIHGGETEGIATSLNCIEILETGKDIAGNEHPGLREKLQQLRLNIIPCLNPDGRERVGVSHLNNADIDHIYLVQQGLLKDGTPLKGRKVKETQPIPQDMMSFMGGYYNVDGVNLQHDDFFSNQICPENQALTTLFKNEIPDGFMTFHAHGAKPAFTGSDHYLFPGYEQKQVEAISYIVSRLTQQNIDAGQIVSQPTASFYFQTYFSQMSGAVPLLFELPHGIKTCYYSFEEILEIGLITIDAWCDFALEYGMRPVTKM